MIGVAGCVVIKVPSGAVIGVVSSAVIGIAGGRVGDCGKVCCRWVTVGATGLGGITTIAVG